MTGYHITLGYNSSGHNGKWDRLKTEATALATEPQTIVNAIKRLRKRGITDLEEECAASFADSEQSAFVLRDEGDDNQHIMLCASGGDPGRTAKEETRRAYCRVLLERMHALGIEINIHVA